MLRIQLASVMRIACLFACLASIRARVWQNDYCDYSFNPIINPGSAGPALQISVLKDPYIVESGSVFYSFCYIRDDQAEVWWTKDDENITFHEPYNRSAQSDSRKSQCLVLDSSSRNDMGNYTCLAKITGGILMKETIMIRVVEPGSIVPVKQHVHVKNNEPATLSCIVQGDPLSNFSWQYELNPNRFGVQEENDLVNTSKISYTNDKYVVMSLHFDRVTVSEHGYYWCIAHDYRGTIFHQIFLNTIGESSVIIRQYELIIHPIRSIQKNSIFISWTTNRPTRNGNKYYIQLQYLKNGTEQWQNYTTRMSSISDNIDVTGLESGTAYQFRFLFVDNFDNSLAPRYSEWVTTLKEDPFAAPTVRIEATTSNSILIRASMNIERENRAVLYKGVVTCRNKEITVGEWQLAEFDGGEYYRFNNLESMTIYQVKVAACQILNNTICGNWSTEQEVVTIDRDPKFVPNISFTESTRDSITIGWTGPGPELQHRVHQYKVIATTENETRGPVYLDKTEESYVFENLTSARIYKLKVAACSDFKTQCGDWSVEQEVLTFNRDAQGTIWLGMVATLLILVIVVIIWLVIQNRRENAARRRFEEATRARFNSGALDSLDPELNIGDQAELLPYNKKWEFPRGLLKLDKVLGSGAFGVVRKAQAKSICQREKVTTVAVKLVRASARLHQMTALTRELKILAHLGKHLNVVNLLGACTQNVSYGELLVIVEFCRFGNLRDYLLHRRTDFEDQVNIITTTDNIDTSSGFSADPGNPNDEGQDAPDCDNGSATEESRPRTDSTNASIPINDPAPGSDSDELGPPYKYHGDYTDDNLEPISTRDLVCWSWQISRGMKYLGSRRILHGDLAARNVLLADRNVVKICDFGLSKALYMDDNYTKKGHGPLPVKWMAIESLRDRVFSVQSDIWSYGIVLWELFTLSETPYHGIDNESVYRKLADGFRLAKPKYATEDIYHTMLRCWDAEPKKRPSFARIEDILIDLLDERVKSHYLDLSAPYAQMNAHHLEHGERDYLTMGPSDDTSDTTEQVQE